MADNFKTRKVRAHALEVDDRMEVGGKMYRVTSVEALSFGIGKQRITLRPIKVDTYHEDIHVSTPAVQKLTIFRKKQ